ncbi:hypothetical protein B0H13DRAFT_1850771 [Mycena leptocephala]|nr:hypothetical protein B0H13DRAFT_1850771 [Mycena leptocephala]
MESRQLSLLRPGPHIERRLDTLWVSRVRSPVQALHEMAKNREFDELESNIQTQMRGIVQDILSDMIILGATKINEEDSDSLSQYYVPGFATMTFAMMERFVSYSGFTDDDDPVFREDIFDVLSLLQCSMVSSPGYLFRPHDAPGFDAISADPTLYGVSLNTKLDQVREIGSNGRLIHQFGSGLPRYEPDSAYTFPVCKPEDMFVATRPNTRQGN